MLFNSIGFFVFLFVVFFLYWFVFNKKLAFQNFFLLIASYFFYAWWDWRFLLLLLLSTVIDYSFGLAVEKAKNKKFYLVLSIVNNLGVLFFFKYYNFFISSFAQFGEKIGLHFSPLLLNIALPVGISFYTFHGMSYVFDIYNGKSKATKNFNDYAVFVCFFPLLVAGPIERASHLLPQVQTRRIFKYEQAVQGMRLMLWGFFKKVVIADTLANVVNTIFGNYHQYNGATLVLGAVLFAFQIYGDFSGYTDIALGTAKLFGFELLTNFKFPYFSRNIAEFWRRWHISLSSWFRDYLYIPLGGSKKGHIKAIRNTFIIFLVSGFWHGANWTFIAWGGLHALLFIPLLLAKRNRVFTDNVVAYDRRVPNLKELGAMITTFVLVTIGWIFFRSATITDAAHYIGNMRKGLFAKPLFLDSLAYVVVFLITDWLQRRDERNVLNIQSRPVRYFIYFVMVALIILHFPYINKAQFIYFQF